MEKNSFANDFRDLAERYMRNERRLQQLSESSGDSDDSDEYNTIINEQNILLVEFNNLQTKVNNSNYDKQNNLFRYLIEFLILMSLTTGLLEFKYFTPEPNIIKCNTG